MKNALSAAATLLLVAGLAACEREANTIVTAPGAGAAPAQGSAATSSTTTTTAPDAAGATTASSASTAPAAGANVTSTSAEYSESMKRLQTAAQRLREAIQAMAQQPAGDRRNDAIREAHAAILETNQAMISMPPDMRIAESAIGTTSGGVGGGAVGNVYPSSDVDYTKAMEKLQKSAQQLRESIQSMAQEPAGERRSQAIKAAHQALFDVNQAMIQLPPDLRTKK